MLAWKQAIETMCQVIPSLFTIFFRSFAALVWRCTPDTYALGQRSLFTSPNVLLATMATGHKRAGVARVSMEIGDESKRKIAAHT